MDYPNKTITDSGANLLASTNGTKNGVIIDKVIISNQLPQANKSLENMTINDIQNGTIKPIDVVKHQENTTQPEITLHNTGMSKDYPINTIGVLAHASNDNSGNETLYVIATASNDPFIMPHQTGTKFDFTIALPMAFSNTSNVHILTTEAGMVTNQEFESYQSSANEVNNSEEMQISSNIDMNNANSANLSTLSLSADSDYQNNSNNISNLAESVKFAGNQSEITSVQNSVASNSSKIINLSNSTNSNYQSVSNAIKNVATSTVNNQVITNLSSSASDNAYQINSLSTSASNDRTSDSNNISNIVESIGSLDPVHHHYDGALGELKEDMDFAEDSINDSYTSASYSISANTKSINKLKNAPNTNSLPFYIDRELNYEYNPGIHILLGVNDAFLSDIFSLGCKIDDVNGDDISGDWINRISNNNAKDTINGISIIGKNEIYANFTWDYYFINNGGTTPTSETLYHIIVIDPDSSRLDINRDPSYPCDVFIINSKQID